MSEKTLDQIKKESLEKILEIKSKGFLPTRYAKAINLKYPHIPLARIHEVGSGRRYDGEIIDAILELAQSNQENQRLQRINDLLKEV